MKKLFLFTMIALSASIVTYSQQKGVLWSEDFEGDWTINWHVDAGTWEVGTPTSGPNSAHEGTKCAATVLGGNYSQPVSSRLIRHSSFVVPAASEHPRLRFWYWFSFSTNDWGEVQIKANNGEWETISVRMDNQGGDAWSYGSIDISKYAGSTVQLAFYFHSADDGNSFTSDVSSGWYMDDVSLVTGPYVLNSPEGFESGFGDWSVDEGTWESGTPSGGPGSAHSGEKCIGTNIDGNYQQASDSRLICPPFIVPAASENPRFRFWYWFSFSTNDWGEVQIKANNGEWETISVRMDNQGGDAWSYGSINISKYAGSTVQLAFYFHSADDGNSFTSDVSSGWYMDDVSLVTGPYVLNSPEGFESGFGDWSVDEGSWEAGSPASGPGSAHSGENSAGTNLEGNYQQASDSRLISPPFIVPAASENPAFRFWHWFSFSTNDWGEVQITTNDGITWETISSQFINTSSGAWSPYYVSLSSYANKKVKLGFYFHSADDGNSFTNDVSSGWYIDDINFDNITGITEISDQKINIYPNPFTDRTTIELNDMNLFNYRLSVFNFSGNIVFEIDKLSSNKIELEKGNLPAGIYIIELRGDKVFRNKIIIK
ncbi:MAG: T9SS type A sorting domain-containing protein [Bacteroidales bacterium]|nr:T9SS type A sorting domain-containing protein [Bacteroidales bacterium]